MNKSKILVLLLGLALVCNTASIWYSYAGYAELTGLAAQVSTFTDKTDSAMIAILAVVNAAKKALFMRGRLLVECILIITLLISISNSFKAKE